MVASEELKAARIALHRGYRKLARKHALRAAAMDPLSEEAWILLAACDSSEAAIRHLQRVLQINPNNRTAQKGLEWLLTQKNQTIPFSSADTQPIRVSRAKTSFSRKKSNTFRLTWILVVLAVFALSVILPFSAWIVVSLFTASAPLSSLPNNSLLLESVTQTPTNPIFPTQTSSPSETPSPSPTATATALPSPTPSLTPQPTATATPTTEPPPTAKAKKKKKKANTTQNKQPPIKNNGFASYLPKGVGENDPWIEVDLSSQTSYAYIGRSMVRSFIVSTGTWQHPTVTGVYRIYVKYRYANMSGPGYYLPNVPYVMYFYKGYGLHGTYWHNNFGVPMSHGCVNYTITDAGWLFDFTDIGTVVYIHE